MAPFSWSALGNRKQAQHSYHAPGIPPAGSEDIPQYQNERPAIPQGALQLPQESAVKASSVRTHSRTNTMTSSLSFYAASTSESSTGDASRPSSRLYRNKSTPSLMEKQGNSARALLSKGSRMLRRQGSKFSLLSMQSSDKTASDAGYPPVPSTEPPNKQSRKATFAIEKRETLKRTISEPFDFQHVTHTNRATFENLGRVNKNELISEFSAIRAGQQSKRELKGIAVEELPSAKGSPDFEEERPTSPTATIIPTLPLTPPRPQPPPKDSSLRSPRSTDVRLSRSVENFSRPNPRSPVSPLTPTHRTPSLAAFSPASRLTSEDECDCSHDEHECSPQKAAPAYHIDPVDSDDKPLPSLPVHAISTEDDTARPMRTAPLPRIPADLADVPEGDESSVTDKRLSNQNSKRLSLRHVHTFPSLQYDESRRNTVVQPCTLPTSGSRTSARLCPVAPTLQPSLYQSDTPSQNRKRVSIGLRAIEVHDWEDAIDYSWDHDAEVEDDLHSTTEDLESNTVALPPTDVLEPIDQDQSVSSATANVKLDQGPNERPTSSYATSEAASTPDLGLMMHPAASFIPRPGHLEAPQPQFPPRRDSLLLHGLGIEAASAFQSLLENRRSGAMPDMDQHSGVRPGMSKSSSQESIILSIASSIMSTQRSSNSTASTVDLTPSIKDNSFRSQPQTPQEDMSDSATDGYLTAAETISAEPTKQPPESEAQISFLPLPRTEARHRRAKSLAPHFAVTASSTSSPKSPLPSSPTHSRKSSSSRIPVPMRTSSIAQVAATETKNPRAQPGRRQRSATVSSTTSRSKHKSRASYSLFPGTMPPQLATPTLST